MVLVQLGEAKPALEQFQLARAIIARLKEQSPDDATLPNDLAELDGEIKKLDETDVPELGGVQPQQAVR
jgi:hypothetical protein